MKQTKVKRYLGAEQPNEKTDTEFCPGEHSSAEEQVLAKKEQESDEYRLSHLPAPPVYGRPSAIEVSHRFGKRRGST